MKRILVLFMMLVLSVALVGCIDRNNNTKFYSLEEAYMNEWLTESDLQKIVLLYNTKTQSELSDQDVEKMIKKTYLKQLKNKVPTATISNVYIKDYYGTYGE